VTAFSADNTLIVEELEVITDHNLIPDVIKLLIIIRKLRKLQNLQELFPLEDKQRTILLRNSKVLIGTPSNKLLEAKEIPLLEQQQLIGSDDAISVLNKIQTTSIDREELQNFLIKYQQQFQHQEQIQLEKSKIPENLFSSVT